MKTSFDVYSTFDIHVGATGEVVTDHYEFNLYGEVLGRTFLDFQFQPSISGSVDLDADYGLAHVEGKIDFGGGVAPHFSDQLMCDDVGSSLWVDPELEVTIDELAHLNLSLFKNIRGAADLDLKLGASVTFEKMAGTEHMLVFEPAVSEGGFSVDTFEFVPSLDVEITGDAGLKIGRGFGSIDATITAMLNQDLSARYSAANGWELAAPGSFSIDGRAHYETFWGRGPKGNIHFLNWEVATWDFFSDTRDAETFGATVA